MNSNSNGRTRVVSRPATYDPDLAFRTKKPPGLSKAELKASLGLDDDDISSEDEEDEEGGTVTYDQYKQLKEELAIAADRERKANASLSKLQLMSKSQTAILKNNFYKKLQESEKVQHDMMECLKSYEAQLATNGVSVCNDFTITSIAESDLQADSDISKELASLRSQVQTLTNENETLVSSMRVLQHEEGTSSDKEMIATLEAEKKKLVGLLKQCQVKIASMKVAASPPAPPTTDDDVKLRKLKKTQNDLFAAENRIKKLEHYLKEAGKKLQASNTTTTTNENTESLEMENKGLKSDVNELKIIISEMEAESKSLKTELATNKERATKTILDLQKSTTESTTLQKCSANLVKTKSDLRILRKEVCTRLNDELPILTKEISKKVGLIMSNTVQDASKLRKAYERELSERRRLFNVIQEMRGNIRVFVRFRPISSSELAKNHKSVCSISSDGDEVSLVGERGKKKSWEMDQVFDEKVSQEQVYTHVQPLVTSILDGYNVCIFAYGQTGAGKSYSMQGPADNPGINTRALKDLLERVKSRSSEFVDEISVSMIEIYNEKIKDLLLPESPSSLCVRQGPNGNYVPNLTMTPVRSMEEVTSLVTTGNANRATHATGMNETSSRSHSVLSVYVKSVNRQTNTSHFGKMHLVDLAGSERLSKTGATGPRLKEAQNINKSLSALGDVIAARCNKASHVPYRNSTLTYLLQDSLGGDSKTLMVACASPVDYNVEESFCTLNFASRTRSVEMGKATVQKK